VFLYSYEANFLQALLKNNEKNLARSFNFMLCPIELEIKHITDTDRSASYLDLHLEIDNDVRLRTKLYEKRDDFNFLIMNIPFICSNIPTASPYGVYIAQLIRYVVLIRISLKEGCC